MNTQGLEDVELARSAVSSASDIVGAKWTPLLIHELGHGTRRFRELERACERDDFRPKPGPLCSWCNFQAHCPAFGGDPARAADGLMVRATGGGLAVTAG